MTVLSYLLLVSTSGQPLPASAVARLAPLPVGLALRPVDMTTWRSEGDHVALVAWSDTTDPWHVGAHGATLVTGRPWPLASRLTAPGGVAMELTSRLGASDDPGALSWLTGATSLVRVRADGSGLVFAPPLGGGQVVVAEGDGLLAVSDRASVAAAGVGGAVRRTDLPDLVAGLVQGERTAVRGVVRLRPGAHVQLLGRDGAKVVDGPTPWDDLGGARVDDLLADAVDDVTRLVDLAADDPEPRRIVELGADPSSHVVAAALAAAGRLDRFVLRAAGPGADAVAAERLAAALGVALEPPPPLLEGGEAADARVRAAVARTEGAVAVTPTRHGLLCSVRDDDALMVLAAGPSVLAPSPEADVSRVLTSQAREALARLETTGREGDPRGTTEAGSVTRRWLARRGPVVVRAAADLRGAVDVLDPLAAPSLARLAVAAADAGQDVTQRLVAALHPPLAGLELPQERPRDRTSWRSLAPVLEAHVLGHGRVAVEDVVDVEEVTALVRSSATPDLATTAALEGALALAVWGGMADRVQPASRPDRRPRIEVALPSAPPVLVTGVTSRSLLDLTAVGVPLDETDVDALLGVRIDRAARDLAHRLLLAVGATPGHLPADLDQRLAGPATAGLAPAAAALLARRGGTLVDPRLAMTLPFWTAHVRAPRVVLVAERPPDLAARSSAQLPTRDLLGWWVDAVAAAAATAGEVRVVDPGDLADLDEVEAASWDGLDESGPGGDIVGVARTVDSLVREVELDAARPLLRTVRASRAAAVRSEGPGPTPDVPAAVPLRVVDELWERAVRADADLGTQRATSRELEAELVAARQEVAQLRQRRGLRAAWQILTGGDGSTTDV